MSSTTANQLTICPLMTLISQQIHTGDYIPSSRAHCLKLQRLDEIARKMGCDINCSYQRADLAEHLEPLYGEFAAYIDECHSSAKTILRNGVCYATLEWHGLHQYLMVSGFTSSAVARYIKADKFDREIFHASRMTGEYTYFAKYPGSFDESAYDASVAPRYCYVADKAPVETVAEPIVVAETPVPEGADPLMSLAFSQMYYDDYASCEKQARGQILKRIDEIAAKVNVPIEEPEQRLALAKDLKPLYAQFEAYLAVAYPLAYQPGRHGRVPASIEWHALHLYLVKNGFCAEAVSRFISKDKLDDDAFSSLRREAYDFYNTRYASKVNVSSYPASTKRYGYTIPKYIH